MDYFPENKDVKVKKLNYNIHVSIYVENNKKALR